MPTPSAAPSVNRRRNIHLDSLRGLLLVLMSFDHLCIFMAAVRPYCRSLMMPAGLFSMAEGFVFLAGFTCAASYIQNPPSPGVVIDGRTKKRLLRIYIAQVLICLHLFWASWKNDFNFGYFAHFRPLIEDPWWTALKSLLLLYAPPTADILPMYFVFVLISPFLSRLILEGKSARVLVTSLLLWLSCQFELPGVCSLTSPTFLNGFNPFAWQILFVFGTFFGVRTTPCNEVKSWRFSGAEIRRAVIASLIVTIAIALRRGFLPVALPQWLEIFEWKNRNLLRPPILINFIAFSYLLALIIRRIPEPRNAVYRLIGTWWGKNSLVVYTLNIILWNTAQAFYPLPEFSFLTEIALLIFATTLPAIAVLLWRACCCRFNALRDSASS